MKGPSECTIQLADVHTCTHTHTGTHTSARFRRSRQMRVKDETRDR